MAAKSVMIGQRKYSYVEFDDGTYVSMHDVVNSLVIDIRAQIRKAKDKQWAIRHEYGSSWISVAHVDAWLGSIDSNRLSIRGREDLKNLQAVLSNAVIDGSTEDAMNAQHVKTIEPAPTTVSAMPMRFGTLGFQEVDGLFVIPAEELESPLGFAKGTLGSLVEEDSDFVYDHDYVLIDNKGQKSGKLQVLLTTSGAQVACLKAPQKSMGRKLRAAMLNYIDALQFKADKEPRALTAAEMMDLFAAQDRRVKVMLDEHHVRLTATLPSPVAVPPAGQVSMVVPLVGTEGSFSMRDVNIALQNKGFDISEGDNALREIAVSMGLIGDANFGFWCPEVSAASGAHSLHWRFYDNAVGLLIPTLKLYAEKRKGGLGKKEAVLEVQGTVSAIGVGKETRLTKNAGTRAKSLDVLVNEEPALPAVPLEN